MAETDADMWVFGYGSLMWRPGFASAERQLASLHGYHRSLCIFSHVHRGTPATPGLVLGLDRGGRCRGVALRVEPGRERETLEYLRAREQATAVYLEREVAIRLADGQSIRATTYVADRRHPQYAGRLSTDDLVRLVRQGVGISGANTDYVRATQQHLMEMGLSDPVLARIAAQLAEAERATPG